MPSDTKKPNVLEEKKIMTQSGLEPGIFIYIPTELCQLIPATAFNLARHRQCVNIARDCAVHLSYCPYLIHKYRG